MLTMLLPTILLLALVVSPLAWRIRADRRRDRADILWTPAGYEDLAETVWRDVAGRMPVDYELVVKPGHAEEPLRHAA